MSDPIDELKVLTQDLSDYSESFRSSDFVKNLDRLRGAAEKVGQSWSGSWEGYQARVYYGGFQQPPPGHHFRQMRSLLSFGRKNARWCWFGAEKAHRGRTAEDGHHSSQSRAEEFAAGKSGFGQAREIVHWGPPYVVMAKQS